MLEAIPLIRISRAQVLFMNDIVLGKMNRLLGVIRVLFRIEDSDFDPEFRMTGSFLNQQLPHLSAEIGVVRLKKLE